MNHAVHLTPRPPMFKRRFFGLRRNMLAGYLFIAPLLLWLAATILYPLLSAIALSLQDVRIIGTPGKFIGLDNYARLLSSESFWQSFGRSIAWVVGNAVVQTLAAFAAALILNQRFRGQQFARIWIILSWIVPTVVVVIIWRWLLSSSGVVNFLLMSLHLTNEPIGFFGAPTSAAASVILINAWRWFPFMAVTVLAGLQSIPQELYEAAAVDGATAIQRFWRITLPLLQPVLFVLGLVGTLLSFNVFDIIWLLTGGGPSNATTTLPVLIYDTAFTKYRLSQAAAISVLSGLALFIFALLFIRFMAPKQEEGS
ncbi:sugar ABC transporter permease [Caldilinea sp.]|jgi:multiple sugar transport system permease protein|uniref:carbohydrate ABC transporter permease n=1 Tax=Caldilinea sp. TaxID=2293560 RepID=UPI001B13AE82|nr:sugar ABC transporter permease [Caldilinea sp.]MBO9392220.1 sugar ABC transporter permease [Caldilinea sp.]